MAQDADGRSEVTPGEAIQARLSELGWTHDDLARILGRHRPEVSNIVQGKRGISPEWAVALSAALGGTPEYWIALDTRTKIAKAKDTGDAVTKRAKVYELAPIKDMQKRGWIARTNDPDILSSELKRFFAIDSLDETPRITVAPREAIHAPDLTPAQRAWCFRAKQLATALQSPPFDETKLQRVQSKLRKAAAYINEAIHITSILHEAGIRFVVVEPIAGAKIDGAVFWLDATAPTIAVSIRFDRIDSFWYTVMHEFAHVKYRDALSVDSDLAVEGVVPSGMKNEIERRADEESANILVPDSELRSFIMRVRPMYSKARIIQFAHRVKMHPGVIVGQLQHLGEIGYQANREMLAKVRDIVTSTAVTDGWGRTISPGTI